MAAQTANRFSTLVRAVPSPGLMLQTRWMGCACKRDGDRAARGNREQTMLRTIWTQYIKPLLVRPSRFQVAALCYRHGANGIEVLVVTSKHTGRWILPKGWPMEGYGAAGVAAQEAWEEAGVDSVVGDAAKIGRYHYTKRLRGGVPVATAVDVYAVEVSHIADEYPEADLRERRWLPAAEAAAAVDEPELRQILSEFPKRLMSDLTDRAEVWGQSS